jgi:predicted ATP-dependent endonuclease of OLD family
MLKITDIHIKRFRSINEIKLKIEDDHNIVTICGENNVGKTNVIRALALFFNKTKFDRKTDIPEFKQMTGGASIYPEISVTINDSGEIYKITKNYNPKKIDEESDLNYHISGEQSKQEIESKICENFLSEINLFYLPSINISFPETINYLIDDKFLDVEFSKAKLKGKKASVKNNLDKARKALQAILDDLTKSINPEFADFKDNWGIKFTVPSDINRFREILNEEINFSLFDDTNKTTIDAKGSGLQRLGHILLNLRIIDKLTNAKKKCILIIDEPDIYLHARLQKKLFSRIKSISEKVQVFITTHSSIFIEPYKMKNLFLLELEVLPKESKRKKEVGNILNTKLADLNKGDVINLLKETLGIEDNDNMVVAKRNIIVEGESDKKYLEELIRFFDFPVCNIIDARGVTNFKPKIEYYNSISKEENGVKFILLFDNDSAGRQEFDKIKEKSYSNITIKKIFVIDAVNSDFSNIAKGNASQLNIEIEDLIYPEIIVENFNKILKKKGFTEIKKAEFDKKYNKASFKFQGIVKILDDLKNEFNPDTGHKISMGEDIKNGIAGLFNIAANNKTIKRIEELDKKYPKVREFIKSLTHD